MIHKSQRLEIWKQLKKKKKGRENYNVRELVGHFLTIIVVKYKILYFESYKNSDDSSPARCPLTLGLLQTILVQDV